ncbi:MAG: hypothetical protein ACI8RD_005307, partial [Bacillariaceae sp.]|jgi:hypothetical protein
VVDGRVHKLHVAINKNSVGEMCAKITCRPPKKKSIFEKKCQIAQQKKRNNCVLLVKLYLPFFFLVGIVQRFET